LSFAVSLVLRLESGFPIVICTRFFFSPFFFFLGGFGQNFKRGGNESHVHDSDLPYDKTLSRPVLAHVLLRMADMVASVAGIYHPDLSMMRTIDTMSQRSLLLSL